MKILRRTRTEQDRTVTVRCAIPDRATSAPCRLIVVANNGQVLAERVERVRSLQEAENLWRAA